MPNEHLDSIFLSTSEEAAPEPTLTFHCMQPTRGMGAAGKLATGKCMGLLLTSRADARQLACVRVRVERSQLLFDAPPTVRRLGGAQVALECELV